MVAEKHRVGLGLARPIADLVGDDPEMLRLMEEASDVMAGAQTIRGVRKAAGLSQTELADRLHVSQARVCEMEAGRGTVGVSYALLLRAVRACGFEPVFSYRRIDQGAEAEAADDDQADAAEAVRPARMQPAEADLTPEERLLRAIFGEDLQPDPNAPVPAPVSPSRGTRRRRGRRIQGYERPEDPDEPRAATLPDEEPEKDQLA